MAHGEAAVPLYTPRTVWKAGDGARHFEVGRGRGEEQGRGPVRRRGHHSSGILMIWCHSLCEFSYG